MTDMETLYQALDRLCAALATTEPAVLLLPAAAHALLLGDDAPEAVERHGTTIVRVGYGSVVLLRLHAEQAVQERKDEARRTAEKARALRRKAADMLAEAEAMENA